MTTIKDFLAQTAKQHGNAIALRYKQSGQWHTMTYRELLTRAWCVSEILAEQGIKPGDRIALYLDNCREWPEIYLGIVGLGAIGVPVDAKLKEQELAHILRDSGASVLFSHARHYPVIHQVEYHVPALQSAILIQDHILVPHSAMQITCEDYETRMTHAAEKAVSENRAYDRHHPASHDIASLIYTSGTTGRQKGAMLSHRNFTANVESCLQVIQVKREDNFMLVLPLHHTFAFTTNFLIPLAAGAEISFAENLKTMGENIEEAQPSVLITVPLLLEKIHTKIQAEIRKKTLPTVLSKLGLSRWVGKGITRKLGGRLRIIITGGAPCDPGLIRAWCKWGIPVCEGYGLTETSPALTFNPLDKIKPGTVGPPIPGVSLRIHDANAEGIGEITASGENIMQGYYNNPQETEAVLRDQQFHTGDLGCLDEEGYLVISGRMKSLIVNREGKNIYPEEVEAQVCKSPYILEALALGYRAPSDQVGEHVGLIVVPDMKAIDDYTKTHEKHMNEEAIRNLIQEEVKRLARSIAAYKRPRHLQIRYEEFLKTSTAKIKRYLYAIDTSHME